MWTIVTCITQDHDLRLVALAALVCVLAAGTAFAFHRSSVSQTGGSRLLLNVGIGLIVGGGVWATHFIAMLAYNVGFPLNFDIEITVLSLIVAILGMGLGFALASMSDRAGILTTAGTVVGISIVSMHFTGIAAIRSALGMEWKWGFVVASVAAAIVGATAALFAIRRIRRWPGWATATGCLVLGIVGLHFTAMAAIEIIPDLTPAPVGSAIDPMGVALMTGLVAVLIISASGVMAAILAHNRRSGLRNMQAAFGGLPIGLALFDVHGRLTLWNEAFERLLEISPLRGMTSEALRTPETCASDHEVMPPVGDDVEAVHAAFEQAREWRTRQGGWVRMEELALPSGERMTVVTDITQSRNYTSVMADARDRAESANRAKSDFLANMSHEIRTPLNGILGMAQVMACDTLPEGQRDRLKIIEDSGRALLVILNDILDLSKIQAGKLQLDLAAADMPRLVRAVAATFEDLASTKGVSLTVTVPEDVDVLWCIDEMRVRQMLTNLAWNAVKFTDHGKVDISLRQEADGLVLEVADEGIGIAAEDLKTLFDKFTQADTTADRRYGGTGLGLAITRELGELMGATVSVASVLGRGSTFRIVLPAKRAAQIAVGEEVEDVPSAVLGRRLRILAAEDNPTNQAVLKAMLEAFDCDLVVVDDGALAVTAAAANAFDAILMDIQMPGMNGVEATRAIRAAERQRSAAPTPIIALTANVMRDQIDGYVEAGMDRCVAKPIELDKLIASLNAVLQPRLDAAA